MIFPKPVIKLLENSYSKEEFPALFEQFSIWKKSKPLSKIRLLDATPVFRNSLLKYRALISAGADLTVGVSSVIANDKHIVRLIKMSGIPICNADECDRHTNFDIILDCAGAFSFLIPRIGYVELTRSGAEAYNKNDRPVFFADGGKIKRIETCLGTGESYFRAMRHLGFDEWKNRKLVLFGCGKVGSGILLYAYRAGAKTVVVTDTNCIPERVKCYADSFVDFHNIPEIINAINGAYAVVTATGVRNALHKIPAEVLINSGALLANMGVEDEFGPFIEPEYVLNGKRTLNFILEEPTLLRYIDATLALHNAGALYLLKEHLPAGYKLILPPEDMERRILSVTKRNGMIGEDLDIIV